MKWAGGRRTIAAAACAALTAACQQGPPWASDAIDSQAAIEGTVIAELDDADGELPAWSVLVTSAVWLGGDNTEFENRIAGLARGDMVELSFGTDIVDVDDHMVFFVFGDVEAGGILFASDPIADRPIRPFDSENSDEYIDCLVERFGNRSDRSRVDVLVAAAQTFHRARGTADAGGYLTPGTDNAAGWLTRQCPSV